MLSMRNLSSVISIACNIFNFFFTTNSKYNNLSRQTLGEAKGHVVRPEKLLEGQVSLLTPSSSSDYDSTDSVNASQIIECGVLDVTPYNIKILRFLYLFSSHINFVLSKNSNFGPFPYTSADRAALLFLVTFIFI